MSATQDTVKLQQIGVCLTPHKRQAAQPHAPHSQKSQDGTITNYRVTCHQTQPSSPPNTSHERHKKPRTETTHLEAVRVARSQLVQLLPQQNVLLMAVGVHQGQQGGV